MNQTYAMTIVNTGQPQDTWKIWGGNFQQLRQATSNASIPTPVQGGTFPQMQRETEKNTFKIKKLKIKTSGTNSIEQLNNLITIEYKDSTGKIREKSIHPPNYEATNTSRSNIIVIPFKEGLNVDGYIGLKGNIEADTNMTLVFTVDLIRASEYLNSFLPFQKTYKDRGVFLRGRLAPGAVMTYIG